MIVPSQVVTHIQSYLSFFTSLFDVSLTVSAQSVVGVRTVRITTVEDHGLSIGKFIIVTNGLLENAITGVSQVGDNLEFETQYAHDLNNSDLELDDTDLTMDDFTNSNYNTSFNIQPITAGNKFQIINPEVTVPTLNGNEILLENRPLGIKGFVEITDIIDAKTFEFSISDDYPELPQTGVQNIEIVKGIRVAGAATIQRAIDTYTEQSINDIWMYVIMGDVDVSRDRHTHNDGVQTASDQDQIRQRFLQNFETLVVIPSDTELSGTNAQELAYGDIFTANVETLLGVSFYVDGDCSDFLTVSNGHGPGQYNTAFYNHIYVWQIPVDLTYDTGFKGKIFKDVAFREIEGILKPFDVENPDGFEFNVELTEE